MNRKGRPYRASRAARLVTSTVLACFVLACLGLAGTAAEASTSLNQWVRTGPSIFPRSTPEEQGMDSDLLAAGIDRGTRQRQLPANPCNSAGASRWGRVRSTILV